MPLSGPADTLVTISPIKLEFWNAFDPPEQSFWQSHISYDTALLHIEILFPPCSTPIHVQGYRGDLGRRQSQAVSTGGPVLSPCGSVASWILREPALGDYFKIAWPA